MDELSTAIGKVLFSAHNFPHRAQPYLLGQDMGPLREKLLEAVDPFIERARQQGAQSMRVQAAELVTMEGDGWYLIAEHIHALTIPTTEAMEEKIVEEALRRIPEPTDVETGQHMDDWGYADTQRDGFINGARWAIGLPGQKEAEAD